MVGKFTCIFVTFMEEVLELSPSHLAAAAAAAAAAAQS